MAGTPISGALVLRSGEPFVLHVALLDAAGAPQLLSGRQFSLMIAAVGAVSAALSVPAALSGDTLYAVVAINGVQTAALFADFGPRDAVYAIVETIGDAQLTRGSDRLHVEASAAIPSGGDPVTIDLPFTTAIPSPSGLLIRETGARGLSAAEQFAIGGIDAGDPASNAMFAALGDGILAEVQGSADLAVASKTAAADSAEAAAASAGAADLAKQTAGGYRAQALTAQTAATDAAAAAITALGTFPDVATGLAATAEGGYFLVAGTGGIYASRYRKLGGVATGQCDYASKAALDAMAATLRIDGSATEYLWSVANLNGDILFAFRNSLGGLDVPNLRAMAISAASLSAPSLTATDLLTIGGAAMSGTVNPGNLWEMRTPIGDIIAKLDVTGTFHMAAAAVDGPLVVGGALSAGSFSVPGTIAAGMLSVGDASITATSANLVEWRTPIGDIVARIDNEAQAHFASATVHGDLVVTGSIYGSSATVTVPPAPFARVTDAQIATLNGWPVASIPSDATRPPVLSADSTKYGARASIISGSARCIKGRVWAGFVAKLGVTSFTGYISGTSLTVLSIANMGALSINAGATNQFPTLSGSGVVTGTLINSPTDTQTGPQTWPVSVPQYAGSFHAPIAMSVSGGAGAAAITGYIVGTKLYVATADHYDRLVSGATVSGAGVTACTITGAASGGVYGLDTNNGTIGSLAAPVAFTATDEPSDGAEGAAAYAVLKYTDDLDTGIWQEALYSLPREPSTDSAAIGLAELDDGRLAVLLQTTGASPYVPATYGLIINNPDAVSGAFDIGRPTFLAYGTAIFGGLIVAHETYLTIDLTGATTIFGRLTHEGRDGLAFSSISTVPQVPSIDRSFNESSAVPIAGGKWAVYMRSNSGMYQVTSDYDAASWGTPALWSPSSGYPTTTSRSKFVISPSGRMIAVFNNSTSGRKLMTLALSEDGGVTWPWAVPIESRGYTQQPPSYPDVTFDGDDILILYDFGRNPGAGLYGGIGKRLYLARISEKLVRNGASFTASISGTNLHVTALDAGSAAIRIGSFVHGGGVDGTSIIQGQSSGAPGGAGDYAIATASGGSQTVGISNMTTSGASESDVIKYTVTL
jgi:hypothetical protein